jgi:SAM-dependent methyltransferase
MAGSQGAGGGAAGRPFATRVREGLVYLSARILLPREQRQSIRRLLVRDSRRTPLECPVCGYRGVFDRGGHDLRANAACRRCGSLERHRFQYLHLTRGGTNPLAGKDVLHFAPERFIQGLAKAARRYETADLLRAGVDHQIDITRTGLPDASYDVIICNHVLEHIPDDRQALRELHRLLRPGGMVVLSVPYSAGMAATYEDPAIADPRARLQHFGQEDHVRRYGRDFAARVRDAGFAVEEAHPDPADCARYHLGYGDSLFIARKG